MCSPIGRISAPECVFSLEVTFCYRKIIPQKETMFPSRKMYSLTGQCISPIGSCISLQEGAFPNKKLLIPDRNYDSHTSKCVSPTRRWIAPHRKCVPSYQSGFLIKEMSSHRAKGLSFTRKLISPKNRCISPIEGFVFPARSRVHYTGRWVSPTGMVLPPEDVFLHRKMPFLHSKNDYCTRRWIFLIGRYFSLQEGVFPCSRWLFPHRMKWSLTETCIFPTGRCVCSQKEWVPSQTRVFSNMNVFPLKEDEVLQSEGAFLQ